ncbi:MAG: HAD hydrolase family protein [Bacteroidota bacterium]|nr:HAD hydrolase family protein [Bacteroidota bacterium]
MIAVKTTSAPSVQDEEEQFYSFYEWCLNPLLTVRELFQRLYEELDRFSSLRQEWQKEESMINVYLFVCAVGCAVDDFLAVRRWKLHKLKERFPFWSIVFSISEWILSSRSRIVNMFFRKRIARWKREWDRCVEYASLMLVGNSIPRAERLQEFRKRIGTLMGSNLPDAVVRRRMKIHEGFRCQDLTHADVFSLMQKFIAQSDNQYSPVMIVGVRTAGAYFAPLAKAYLSSLGWPNVSWITVRPKEGLTRWEKHALRRIRFRHSPVLVIDDYQNTGQTFLQVSKLLSSRGISPHRVVFLAPKHPFETGWKNIVRKMTGSKVLTLEHHELYKNRLMQVPVVEELMLQYFHGEQWNNVRIQETPEMEKINSQLRLHDADSFQVRLKRLYECYAGSRHKPEVQRIIAKSVGWGWLGYHAFIVSKRMHGFVPECLGLRNGFLFMKWIDSAPEEMNEQLLPDMLSSYLAVRASTLRLKEDPRSGNPDYGWGWLEMLGIVRSAYGNYLGRLIDKKLLTDLRGRLRCVPVLSDGKLSPGEWLRSHEKWIKVDFEHHNFGAPELDVVDPAYDIAGAVFEFQMSENAEEQLIQSYVNRCGDSLLRDRLLLYKILYGVMAMRKATESAQRLRFREHSEVPPVHQSSTMSNKRSIYARMFLANTVHRFAASLYRYASSNEWTKKLFFLDVDGVYDIEVLRFPHTTLSGVQAIACLRANTWSIVLNTGRSIHHVKSYCTTDGFQGGIGEYGSVFFDAVQNREIPLIDNDGREQLKRCREVIRTLPGTFIDPEYRYAVRAYRFANHGSSGLNIGEIKSLLAKHNLHQLTFIARKEDTYIVQRECNKKAGVRFVRKYLENREEAVAAIGDSDEDIGMLEEAEYSYAPRNCSKEIRRRAASAGWKIMRHAGPVGLLEAAEQCTQHSRRIGKTEFLRVPGDTQKAAQLMFRILRVAEQPKLQRLFAMIK